jgi:molybdopterin-containing oxidoreductase family membrane subunit
MSGAHFDSETAVGRPAAPSGDAVAPRFLRPASRSGWLLLLLAFAALSLLALVAARRLAEGVGVFALGRPVGWAADVAGLGFWLGLALAGSAIAFGWERIAREGQRAISRGAATVSRAAAGCALVVGLLHLGRSGLAHWLLPLPVRSELWPQWRSPIAWATLAVAAWAALAVAGWRSRTASPRREAATAGAALVALALVAASSLAAPVGAGRGLLLILAFAAGALVAGLAATLVLVAAAGTELGRLPAALAACALGFGGLRLVELLAAWSGGDAGAASRVAGPLAGAFWLVIAAGVVAPQLVRLASVNASRAALVGLALAAAAGVALDRLVEPLAAETRGPLPATWSGWAPGGWDAALVAGCVGLFAALCAAASSPRRGIDKFDADELRRSATSGSPTPLEPEVT